jgi:hypothetical protein
MGKKGKKKDKKINVTELTAEWFALYQKLNKIKSKEAILRQRLVEVIVPADASSKSFDFADERFTAKRMTSYSVPKEEVVALKDRLDEEEFNSLFNISYSVRSAGYKDIKPEIKEKVDAVLSISNSFSITQK